MLFSSLCGDASIQEAIELIPTSNILHTYAWMVDKTKAP